MTHTTHVLAQRLLAVLGATVLGETLAAHQALAPASIARGAAVAAA